MSEEKPITRNYTNFDELVKNEPELMQCFKDELYDVESISDIEEYICEAGDSDESVDSNYITTTYTSETENGDFLLECSGSSYRKDMSVCDEEMAGRIWVTDQKRKHGLEAESFEKEKQEKAEKHSLMEKRKLKILELNQRLIDYDQPDDLFDIAKEALDLLLEELKD